MADTYEIFDAVDYRSFMRDYFHSQPKKGFGQLSKTAKALNMQPSLLTGILSGYKNLTLEQAFDFADYIGLSELESECFTSLVQFERAGTERLRKHFSAKL